MGLSMMRSEFLKGQDEEVVEDLHSQMQKAADALEFERAVTFSGQFDKLKGHRGAACRHAFRY